MIDIYVPHSSDFDYTNELYFPLRNSNLNKKYNIILPHEKSKELFSSEDFFRDNNVLIIAEVSYPSTGMGMELYCAKFFGRKIICIYKKGYKISSSLKTVSNVFIEYENAEDMVNKIEQYLKGE